MQLVPGKYFGFVEGDWQLGTILETGGFLVDDCLHDLEEVEKWSALIEFEGNDIVFMDQTGDPVLSVTMNPAGT
jgi:hypothetical protein